jgi:rhamnogalacturonyl hydrolase YesR|tara:strand:- start:801 stop:1916 length:1116 start_codon:yes stop_codon:yes gene_type:complete
MNKENKIKNLINWLDKSGIQDENGGVYSWWDSKKNKYGFFYSEITGYFITLNLYLYKIYKTDNFLLNAEKAANWIEKNALLENGAILTRQYLDEKNETFSFEGKNIFSFDSGMVLTGFCYLYKETQNMKYLTIAKKIANYIIDNFITDDAINPILNLNKNRYIIDNSKWSFQQGSFLNKVAISFYELSQITGDDKYKRIGINICERSYTFLKNENYFITNKDENCVEMHPLCYSLEGIFFIGKNCKIQRYMDTTHSILEWMEAIFKKNSTIYETYNPTEGKFLDTDRSDIYGQLLRLLKITQKKNTIEQNLEDIILSMISNSENKNEKGGIYYNKSKQHINSWSAMFNLQALIVNNKNILNQSNQQLELIV